MTKLLLRALNAPGLIFLAILGVAIQTSLFSFYPLNYLQPDVILAAVVWCALRRNFGEGGFVTLILANIAEIHTAGPRGLFMISYMVVYLAVRLALRVLVITNFSSLVILTMAMSIVWKLSGLAVLYLMGASGNQWRHTLSFLLPGSIMTGVVSIWLYRLLEWFDIVTFKHQRAQQGLEDELHQFSEGH